MGVRGKKNCLLMPTTLVSKNAARDVGGEDGRGMSGGVKSGEQFACIWSLVEVIAVEPLQC